MPFTHEVPPEIRQQIYTHLFASPVQNHDDFYCKGRVPHTKDRGRPSPQTFQLQPVGGVTIAGVQRLCQEAKDEINPFRVPPIMQANTQLYHEALPFLLEANMVILYGVQDCDELLKYVEGKDVKHRIRSLFFNFPRSDSAACRDQIRRLETICMNLNEIKVLLELNDDDGTLHPIDYLVLMDDVYHWTNIMDHPKLTYFALSTNYVPTLRRQETEDSFTRRAEGMQDTLHAAYICEPQVLEQPPDLPARCFVASVDG